MLLACQACSRLYDVGDLAPGRSMRCTCGTRTPVPRKKPRQKEIANCGNCGAPLESGAKRCGHCSARVTLAEEGLGQPCPACFARLLEKARFCSACGLALKAEARLKAVTRDDCPRCDERLAVTEGRLDPFHQCTSCGGIWLSRKAFERVLDTAKDRPATAEERRELAAALRRVRRPRREPAGLRCPVCAILMLVQEFATCSGVRVDACLDHGWWFDDGELERIRRFVSAGGLEAADQRRKARRRSRSVAARWRRMCAEERDGEASLRGILFGFRA